MKKFNFFPCDQGYSFPAQRKNPKSSGNEDVSTPEHFSFAMDGETDGEEELWESLKFRAIWLV